MDRRPIAFLRGTAALGADSLAGDSSTSAQDPGTRQSAALAVRQNAAAAQSRAPVRVHSCNGDEEAWPNLIGSYSKGLPHSLLGEVQTSAYQALLAALDSGKTADFEQVPSGLGQKLINPAAAQTFSMSGGDSHVFHVDPAPTFSSAAMAADMIELYWQAHLRDVNFADYASSAAVRQAVTELSTLSAYTGPRDSTNRISAATLFRGLTPGDLNGPYLSQFILQPYPINSGLQDQTVRVGKAGVDYLRTFADWNLSQRGSPPTQPTAFDSQPRYIRNGRDLAQWVHYDYPQLAFQNAAFIVFDARPETVINKNIYQLAESNPYKHSLVQSGFVTFGMVHVLSLIAFTATEALKAAWFQKWMVHRRLRPEAMGGRLHNQLVGASQLGIPAKANADSGGNANGIPGRRRTVLGA